MRIVELKSSSRLVVGQYTAKHALDGQVCALRNLGVTLICVVQRALKLNLAGYGLAAKLVL